ncbi:unnamed protein product [Lymnaea stagnalis]|uniref:Aminotransferase class V domain-containing protein n=1 Tax=Lymnaea stagnalis TaxID=6523 RepID=A0AAV2HLQ4_LYMST
MDLQAKRDFGSFHASNVEELLSISEQEYVPPEIPFSLPFSNYSFQGLNHVYFGKKSKEMFFLLEENCCFLNHGAFGGALKQALDTVHMWQRYTESQPLRFFDRQLLPLLVHVSRRLAAFVGCDPKDLVLVNNATFATNSVLSSFPFAPKDVILTFNITYGAVKKHVQYICSKTGAQNREAVIQFPVHDKQQVLDVLEKELSRGDIKLVIIDHIPSNTPVIMPVEDMIQICRQRGAKVLIDGAHALGALDLQLTKMDPDYYVSNAHKWLCSPKGVGFLYVKRELQSGIRPAVISHGFGSGFCSEFVWSGLHDYSSMLSLHTVLDFWLVLGPDRIRDYMYKTARAGAELLANSWSSQFAAPLEMFGTMALVELPATVMSEHETVDYNAAESIQNILYHDYNIEVPIKSVQGHLYVRISAHIYNEVSDYQKLAQAILSIAQKKYLKYHKSL